MPHLPRLLTLLALVAALMVRTLVPDGWMPAAAQGAFAIEPCPGAAPMPMAGMGHHGSHKDQHSGDCAFSPLHSGFAPAAEVALPAPKVALAAAPAQLSSAAPAFPTGPPSPPPPATGPPTLA